MKSTTNNTTATASATASDPRLTQKKNGKWWLVWAEKGADGLWRTRSASAGTTDLDEAKAFLRDWLALSAQAPSRDPVTVGQLIDDYLDHARDRHVGRTQEWSLKPVNELLGAYTPPAVTLDVQRAYRRRRGVAEGTLRRELGALSAVLHWAVKHRKITDDMAPFIQLPPSPPPREVFLDEAEEARLWALASQDEDHLGRLTPRGLFVCLGLSTGARSGAIYALTWDRVDLARGTIDFRVPGERVTKKRKVVTSINQRLMAVLTRAKREALFGGPVVAHEVRGSLETFLAKHGFGHVTPHVFRHTFVTLSLRAGMGIWDVSELVGASPNVLYSVYGHHVSDARLRAVAEMRFKS